MAEREASTLNVNTMKDKEPAPQKRGSSPRKPKSDKSSKAPKATVSKGQYLTTQVEQLTQLFQQLSMTGRRDVLQYAEAQLAKEQEERAALEREMEHNEWLRNFDAKMKADGVEYCFVDDAEDGLTSEQRWDEVANILATIALRVMNENQKTKESTKD